MLHKTSHKRLRARKVEQELPAQKKCHRMFPWLWELDTLGLEKGVEQWDLADKIMCPLNVLLIEREIRHGFHLLFSHHHSVSTIKSTGMQMKYQWKKRMAAAVTLDIMSILCTNWEQVAVVVYLIWRQHPLDGNSGNTHVVCVPLMVALVVLRKPLLHNYFLHKYSYLSCKPNKHQQPRRQVVQGHCPHLLQTF